jgi:hypothetical protein
MADFDGDALMSFIGQLGKEVDSLKTKITGLNESGGKGMNNLATATEKFGKVVQQYTSGPIKVMDAAVAGLTKTLVGAGGLAVGFAGIAKAFDVFSVGELHVRNFATNTGFTVDSVKNLRVQLSAAGVEAGEANRGIGSIGAKLQEVLALQQTAPLYRSLQASEPAMARHVLNLVNAGKQQEALNYLQQRYNDGQERFKAWLPTVTGYSRAAYEAGKVGMQGLIEPWKFNQDEAANYHKTMTNLGTIVDGVWTSITYTMLNSISKMIGPEGINKLNDQAHAFADGFKSFFDTYVIETLKTTKTELDWVVTGLTEIDRLMEEWIGKSPGEGEGGKESGDLMGRLVGRMRKFLGKDIWEPKRPEQKTKPEEPAGGGIWDWLKKNMSFTSDAKASELAPGSMPGLRDSVEIEKDSNKMLRETRDILQKWDQGESGTSGGIGGGGGGAAGAGGNGGSPTGGGSRSSGGPPGVPGAEGDTSAAPASGNLATQRSGFMKELENNPRLKSAAIDLAQREGGVQSNLEQLFNYASMRGMTIAQAMNSGQYGPVNKGRVTGNISAALQAKGEAALEKVYAGSNITNYATDQGMRGDPNFAKYAANPNYWGMHKVEGAWFSSHGERGRRWADQQRQRDAIDGSFRRSSGSSTSNSTATVDIDFSGQQKEVPWMSGASPFIKTKIHRSPQAAIAGGGVADFNPYAFE